MLIRTSMLLTGVVVAVAISCGSPRANVGPTPPGPSVSAYCLSAADRPHAAHFAGLYGEVVGSGPIGLVLTNGSANDPCVFRPLLDRLETAPEYRTLLYFFQGSLEQNIAAAAKLLRSQGCRQVILIGQSVGGRETLLAASTLNPPPSAAISLSGESTAEEVNNLNVPTLMLASEEDRFFPGSSARQAFSAIATRDKQLMVFAGGLHGAELFSGPQAEEALSLVLNFVKAYAKE